MTAFWTRINTFLLLLVLLVLGGILGVLATRIEGGPLDPTGPPSTPTDGVRLPGTPITEPTTITQSGYYYFTRDVNSGVTNVITIAANNVTLDLNGFKLAGGDNVGSTGIIIPQTDPPWENIVIRNGTVRDFHVGINVSTGVYVRVEDVRVLSNIRGVHIGTRATLSGCTVAQNSENGVLTLTGTSDSTIDNCRIGPNGNAGVQFAGSDNVITDSYIDGNGNGLDVHFIGSRNVVRDSYLGQVTIDGQRNVVIDNACVRATSDGTGGGGGNVISPAGHPNVTCFP